MAHQLLKNLSPILEKRLLYLFNQVRKVEDITSISWEMEDGDDEYGIGEIVAQRIIDKRKTLSYGRYTSAEQLADIPGLGTEKIEDIVKTFSIPSAEAFKRAMFRHVLQTNFELTYHSISFDHQSAFEAVVKNPKIFKDTISKHVHELASEYTTEEALSNAKESLKTMYVETYKSGYVGSYAFALWFFRFDQDNWFTFEQVRKITEEYLDISFLSSDHQVFHLFKGFQNKDILSGGITTDDLPVVVNYDEQLINIWAGQLFD